MITMPFLHDIDPRDEQRSPAWAAFATIGGQVERMVAVNVGWALQLAPGGVALAFPEIPAWLRVPLILYSATVLGPATAVLFGVARYACRGQHVDVQLVKDLARQFVVPSLRTLAPLYGTFGVLIWALVATGPVGLAFLQTPLTLTLLLWSVCATYWGPLLITGTSATVRSVAVTSVRLTWRYPGQTLWTWVLTGAALVLGVVSIGGLVLVVPIFIAVLQTHRHIAVTTPTAAEVGNS
jgi:hypothetical protein